MCNIRIHIHVRVVFRENEKQYIRQITFVHCYYSCQTVILVFVAVSSNPSRFHVEHGFVGAHVTCIVNDIQDDTFTPSAILKKEGKKKTRDPRDRW